MLTTVTITKRPHHGGEGIVFTLPRGNQGLIAHHLLVALSHVMRHKLRITFSTGAA